MLSEQKMRSFIQEQIDSYVCSIAKVEQDLSQGSISEAYAGSATGVFSGALTAMQLFLKFYDERLSLGMLDADGNEDVRDPSHDLKKEARKGGAV